MAEITRPPISIKGQGPNGTDLMAFDEDHTISDIVRYAVACSNGSTVETRCICDWIDVDIAERKEEDRRKAEIANGTGVD